MGSASRILSALRGNRSRAELVLLTLLTALLGVLAWRFASHAATLLAYPYEWDEDEGYHIYFAKCLLGGQPIYGDINQVPMLPQTYPPVHAAVLAPFVRALGATLATGRLVSLLALAGIILVVAAAVRQETGRWSLGVLAGALVLGSPFVNVWGPLCRVDILMLFLVVAGLLVIRQYPRRRAALVPGLLLLLLACYTKQQAAVLVPAAFVHLWQHNHRTALLGFAGFAAAGLAGLLALQLWSGGYFWNNVVTAQATGFRFSLILTRAGDFLGMHALLVAGTLGWLVWEFHARRLGIWSAFALTSAVVILLSGKLGAAFNYCLPAVVVAALCTVLAIERACRSFAAVWPAHIAVQVSLLLLILQAAILCIQPVSLPTAQDRQAGDRILRLVRDCNGDPLVERRAMFSVLANRRPQADFCLIASVNQQDLKRAQTAWPPGSYRPHWDPHALLQAIREKRFPLIVMEPVFIPPEAVAEMAATYRVLEGSPIAIGNWHGKNTYQLCVPK